MQHFRSSFVFIDNGNNLTTMDFKMGLIKMIDRYLTGDYSSNIKLLRISLYLLLLLQIYLFYPLIGKYQDYNKDLPHSFAGIFDSLMYNNFLYDFFPASSMVLVFSVALALGILFENIFIKSLICILSYSFHHYMDGAVDAGDALIDTFTVFLVFLGESNKNKYRQLITNSVYFAALFQVAFVYVMAGVGKLYNPLWLRGDAIYHVLNTSYFTNYYGKLLVDYPMVLTIATLLTLAFQVTFPIIIWVKKARPIYILIGSGIHLGIATIMGLTTFGIAMSISYIVFYDPKKSLKILNGVGSSFKSLGRGLSLINLNTKQG